MQLASEYGLCQIILGVEKGKCPCFGYKIGICKGACVGKEDTLQHNIRFIEAFGKDKIKPWPFHEAITIQEHDSVEHLTDVFQVDKWCLITEGSEDLMFDFDIYKILKKYILKRGVDSHLSITEKSFHFNKKNLSQK